jgi:hypothetical protein
MVLGGYSPRMLPLVIDGIRDMLSGSPLKVKRSSRAPEKKKFQNLPRLIDMSAALCRKSRDPQF